METLSSFFLPFFPESKTDINQTQCYSGYKNNLVVYKVESPLAANPPNLMRIIAVERQSTAEVEVQAWNTMDGKGGFAVWANRK